MIKSIVNWAVTLGGIAICWLAFSNSSALYFTLPLFVAYGVYCTLLWFNNSPKKYYETKRYPFKNLKK